MTLYGHRNHCSLVEQQCIAKSFTGRRTCKCGNRCNVCKRRGGLRQFILDRPLTSTREYTQCHHHLPPLLAYAKKINQSMMIIIMMLIIIIMIISTIFFYFLLFLPTGWGRGKWNMQDIVGHEHPVWPLLLRPEDLTLLLLRKRVTRQLLWILLHHGITEFMKRRVQRLRNAKIWRWRLENYGLLDV